MLEAEQALRGHDDQGATGCVERLPPQEMEVLSGRRAVRHANVLLRGELEEALEPRARVLGPVAFVSMWQQQRQPGRLAPLRQPGDDELVDHDLGAVDEIAELRFPEHERLRGCNGIAVLEAQTGVFRERRVVDLERGGLLVEVLQRCVGLAGLHVVQHRVAVGEGAALCVLSREADGNPFDEQRPERESLRLAPVDPARVDRLQPPFELALELRVDREVIRGTQELVVELAESARGNGRDDTVARGVRDPALDRARRAEGRLERLVRLFQLRCHGLEVGGGLLVRDDVVFDQLLRELLADGRMLGDLRGHQRLRVGGLVLLVVSVPAIADKVDHDVALEPATECEREPDRRDRRLGIVGVDVDDRDVEPFCEVARVARRAPFARIGREADLVVRDHVQRAAGRVAVERRQVQRLGDLALARERRVSVNQDRERDARVVQAVAR